MVRGGETGLGSWAALILLLVSSAVVLGLQWNEYPFWTRVYTISGVCWALQPGSGRWKVKGQNMFCSPPSSRVAQEYLPRSSAQECDGGLRMWLLTVICVTAVCSALGALFHGRGDGTRPSRFLDNDDDDDDDNDTWGGVDDGSFGVSVSVSSVGGNGHGPTSDANNSATTGRVTPPLKMEEGGGGGGTDGMAGVNGGGRAEEEEGGQGDGRRDSMGEESITSGVPSSISYRLATQSSSLQHRYFGPGPKLFPDAIFIILVASQWFLAGWSVFGAALYFRLFTGNRTCSPLLRHWTLLVVIIGFLSCFLAVCYSGIMCCMLGGPFRRRRHGNESDGFQGDLPSSSHGAGADNIPGLM
ncbi:unnamed protein product [Pylaiella littoralis]